MGTTSWQDWVEPVVISSADASVALVLQQLLQERCDHVAFTAAASSDVWYALSLNELLHRSYRETLAADTLPGDLGWTTAVTLGELPTTGLRFQPAHSVDAQWSELEVWQRLHELESSALAIADPVMLVYRDTQIAGIIRLSTLRFALTAPLAGDQADEDLVSGGKEGRQSYRSRLQRATSDRDASSQTPTSAALAASPATVPPDQAAIAHWQTVFEQVPLPLALQTADGRVLAQNYRWRREVGRQVQLQFPADRGATPPPASNGSSSSQPWRTTAIPAGRSPQTNAVWSPLPRPLEKTSAQAAVPPVTYLSLAGGCQPGKTAETWLCTAKQPIQSVRIWQVTPLHLALSPTQRGQVQALFSHEIEPTPESMASPAPANQPVMASSPIPPDPLPAARAWQFEPPHLAPPREASMPAQPTTSRSLETTMVTAATPPPPPPPEIWLCIAQDVTDEQLLSQELVAKNADLTQLTRFKDDFLACISHELKSPLTAVLGLSHLLKTQSFGELNQRQARYTNLIHRSGQNLMAIVNDILDLTRIEAGQMELSPLPIAIATICHQAIAQARQTQVQTVDEQQAATRAIQLDINLPLETIVADEARLRQILSQLLTNALKFTPDDGAVGLKVQTWGRWIAFTVWDEGIGIPDAEQHLIFQKFQQIENPRTRQHGGTGLGLVLTQRLARMHGGDITFTSKAGEGSEFTLLLPPAPPQSDLNLALAQRTYLPAHNQLILIVEAVPRFVEDALRKVADLGYQTAIARSGPEAIAKIRRLQPYAVLLNPLLPSLSGWDVLTLLKSDPETEHIPIIITATLAEQEQACQYRANDFLTLPLTTKGLKRSLAQFQSLAAPAMLSSVNLEQLTVLHIHATSLLPAPPEAQSSSDLPPSASATSPAALPDVSTKPPIAEIPGAPEPPPGNAQPNAAQLTSAVEHLLHVQRCRVVEADDLDQAEMLARVWRPDVMLIDPQLNQPQRTLQQLAEHTVLADLPLITLSPAMTRLANQLPALKVFPCFLNSSPPYSAADAIALNQVLQIAAGLTRRPHVLLWDATQAIATDTASQPKGQTLPSRLLTPLVHYLQAANVEANVCESWPELERHLHHDSADLVLITLNSAQAQTDMPQLLEQWPRHATSPIVVLDTAWGNGRKPASTQRLKVAFGDRITTILTADISIDQLLEQINILLLAKPGAAELGQA